MARGRIGRRRHFAEAQSGGGAQDDYGQVIQNWTTVVEAWPCELLTTRGGERIRGRQVSASTTHVLIGEYSGGAAIEPTMRLVVTDPNNFSQVLNVVASYDPDGDGMELRVEANRDGI